MTKAEQIFVSRMVFHIEAGLSFVDAAKAVLADDRRIYDACQSEEVKSELCANVYNACLNNLK